MDRKLLDLLVCPATFQPLQRLDARQRELLNAAIARGEVKRGDGHAETAPVTDGLLTRDCRNVYRIDDGIPVLLLEEALRTEWIDGIKPRR